MSEWLKALLGVEDVDIPPDASVSFEFANAPSGSAGLVFLLILLALAAGVFWIYRREGNAPPRAKLILGLLRMLVFACVLLVVWSRSSPSTRSRRWTRPRCCCSTTRSR